MLNAIEITYHNTLPGQQREECSSVLEYLCPLHLLPQVEEMLNDSKTEIPHQIENEYMKILPAAICSRNCLVGSRPTML